MLNLFSDVNLSNKLLLEKQLRVANVASSSYSSINEDSFKRHGDRVMPLGLSIYTNKQSFTNDICVHLVMQGDNDAVVNIDLESIKNMLEKNSP
jgi:hypothetical protein